MGATVDEYLAGKNQDGVEMFLRLRDLVLDLGEVDERVHTAEVAWVRKRIFAAAFIYSSRVEIAIDLLRRVHHPRLREAYPATTQIITHRLSIALPEQIDDGVAQLLAEAYETVGAEGFEPPTAGV